MSMTKHKYIIEGFIEKTAVSADFPVKDNENFICYTTKGKDNRKVLMEAV